MTEREPEDAAFFAVDPSGQLRLWHVVLTDWNSNAAGFEVQVRPPINSWKYSPVGEFLPLPFRQRSNHPSWRMAEQHLNTVQLRLGGELWVTAQVDSDGNGTEVVALDDDIRAAFEQHGSGLILGKGEVFV
jgi:hypothetical protein